uniref:non-specific serine/threonine protein kinase n=1 Tax=Blastobotrys adeninivorans TaxID=409370 RepID=A0A060T731_BLAAD
MSDSATPDEVTDKLQAVKIDAPSDASPEKEGSGQNFKQTRLLGETTHHYETFSLPPSRVGSYDGTSGITTEEHTEDEGGAIELNVKGKRPSAAYLSSANELDNSSPSQPGSQTGSQPGSPNRTSFYLASETQSKGDSGESSPQRSRTKSHDSSSSPTASPASTAATTATGFPTEDHHDPYARRNRPPPVMNPNEIASRFVFSKRSKSKTRSSTSLKSLMNPSHTEKRAHSLLQVPNNGNNDDSDSDLSKKRQGSKLELKRFFRPLRRKKSKSKHKASSTASPTLTPSNHNDSFSSLGGGEMPFMEEGFKKYGKIGRVLGSGAGGSVRLMKRQSDGTVFAVKEFRERHPNESEREYAKKVTAEFCVGSTLHHPNIIETLDIIKEGGRYFEVMEYGPYDFFAIVMSGKMSAKEIGCCFRQLLAGVNYIHDLGLAHRDLKLDNCVVSEQGILKIIDFGSASVFRYPFEDDIVYAKGVVGSDPYLAPEVLSERRYDPRMADIWSLAVIFCCMTLRRFPWKAPRMSDNSFRQFATTPNVPITGPENDTQAKLPSSQIQGPWRLLRLLPHGSRHIIGRMLAVDPKARAQMEEINSDGWIDSLQMCTIDKTGTLVKGTDHEHTFVPSEQAHLEAYK